MAPIQRTLAGGTPGVLGDFGASLGSWRDPRLTGLLIANEWLDDVPVDVVEGTPGGPRLVLVDPSGEESYDGPPDEDAAAWLARWWPLGPGLRAEVGLARDAAWAHTLRCR